ncbi:MAG: hypothetical protein AB1757_17040 [Acidobacteriota bacterium]
MLMTTIAILPEQVDEKIKSYRAIAGHKQSVGKTAGEALDELTKQLSEEEANMLVVIQNLRADQFFTAAQQSRLSELMARLQSP